MCVFVFFDLLVRIVMSIHEQKMAIFPTKSPANWANWLVAGRASHLPATPPGPHLAFGMAPFKVTLIDTKAAKIQDGREEKMGSLLSKYFEVDTRWAQKTIVVNGVKVHSTYSGMKHKPSG